MDTSTECMNYERFLLVVAVLAHSLGMTVHACRAPEWITGGAEPPLLSCDGLTATDFVLAGGISDVRGLPIFNTSDYNAVLPALHTDFLASRQVLSVAVYFALFPPRGVVEALASMWGVDPPAPVAAGELFTTFPSHLGPMVPVDDQDRRDPKRLADRYRDSLSALPSGLLEMVADHMLSCWGSPFMLRVLAWEAWLSSKKHSGGTGVSVGLLERTRNEMSPGGQVFIDEALRLIRMADDDEMAAGIRLHGLSSFVEESTEGCGSVDHDEDADFADSTFMAAFRCFYSFTPGFIGPVTRGCPACTLGGIEIGVITGSHLERSEIASSSAPEVRWTSEACLRGDAPRPFFFNYLPRVSSKELGRNVSAPLVCPSSSSRGPPRAPPLRTARSLRAGVPWPDPHPPASTPRRSAL